MSKKNTKTKAKAAPKAKAKVKAKPNSSKAGKKAPVSKPKAKSKPAVKAKSVKKIAAIKAKAPVKKVAKVKVAPKAKVTAKKATPAPKKVAAKVIAPKSLASKTVAAKPVAAKPVAAKPVPTKPVATKPSDSKTVAAKPLNTTKVELPAKGGAEKLGVPGKPAGAPIFKASPGRRRKKEKAPTVVKIEVPRNEIPAPPKNRPVIGRPAPFNRRPEPSLTRPKPVVEDSGKTRYSDNELEEFRAIINKKLEDARKELLLLQAQMTAANEHGTDDTASTFKILEDGSDSLAKEEAGQLAGRQKKFIEQLENAMIRIENKTYGICRVSGKLIPKERLRAVPHTTQTIEAKLNQYRD